jgi:hypothetical protein
MLAEGADFLLGVAALTVLDDPRRFDRSSR